MTEAEKKVFHEAMAAIALENDIPLSEYDFEIAEKIWIGGKVWERAQGENLQKTVRWAIKALHGRGFEWDEIASGLEQALKGAQSSDAEKVETPQERAAKALKVQEAFQAGNRRICELGICSHAEHKKPAQSRTGFQPAPNETLLPIDSRSDSVTVTHPNGTRETVSTKDDDAAMRVCSNCQCGLSWHHPNQAPPYRCPQCGAPEMTKDGCGCGVNQACAHSGEDVKQLCGCRRRITRHARGWPGCEYSEGDSHG